MTGRRRYYVLGARVPRWLWRAAPTWKKWQEWRAGTGEAAP